MAAAVTAIRSTRNGKLIGEWGMSACSGYIRWGHIRRAASMQHQEFLRPNCDFSAVSDLPEPQPRRGLAALRLA
jgi:hypothetical protein